MGENKDEELRNETADPTEEASGETVEAEETTEESAEETADKVSKEEAREQEDSEEKEADESAAEEGEDEEDTSDSDVKDADWEPTDSGKKSLFGRKKKEDKRDQQIEELTDRVQRQMAEFDNFRKRSEKEKSAMFEMGAKSVLEKFLPIVDNFERGLDGLDDAKREDAFVQGMEKVYKQMTAAMESMGVKTIEAVGQPFDPNFHNAVMHVEDEDADENTVVEEFQKGYLYHDSVLRHSMVKVAN